MGNVEHRLKSKALIIEKITVKAISERARINRNTFYLHYNCVDDVLAEIQAKHSTEYSAIVAKFDQLNNCVVYLYQQWVNDGGKIPLEKMIEFATILLKNGMEGIVAK